MNETRRLTQCQVEAVEWLLDLFLPRDGKTRESPDPANVDQVAEVRRRLGIVGDLEQAARDYIAGAYFDDDPEQRLRTKGAQLTLNSALTLAALGWGDEAEAVRTAQREDAACLERLDGKYAVEGPLVYESEDERVEAIVQTVQASAAYRAGVMKVSDIDPEKPFADLCTAVAERLGRIPVGDAPDGPRATMPLSPADPFVIKYCAVALTGMTTRELANADRIDISVPLDAPLDDGDSTEPLSIAAQVRDLVVSFREMRAKARDEAKAEGRPLAPISRLGSRARDAIIRVHQLSDSVRAYLREAMPVTGGGITPGQSAIESARDHADSGEAPVPFDEFKHLLGEIALRLIKRGMPRAPVVEAIREVMDENAMPFRLG